MKCHYEVLGLGRDASETEIKTAYRKLALQWHPDKNLDQVEEAKERFQLIQQAYEVLSDQHERAWYDNHREQILRGKNSDYEDESLDLFPYFTASCFKGYNDDSLGFYSVYRDVFEKIRQEDAEFMDDTEEMETIPMFGNSESNYEEVVGPFYAYWQSYCTKKSYAWLCPYNINEIKDRRILREVEKEMKKVVQKARKERNEEVRNLVAFVRKRDKRVQANKKLLEDRAALNRMKQEQNRLEQIRRRQKELDEHYKNQSNHCVEEYEEQLRQLTQQYTDSDDDYTSDESNNAEELAESLEDVELEGSEEDYMDDLYCVACNKSFKNLSARLNHETSKKHRDNANKLKEKMMYEEQVHAGVSENETNNCDNMNIGGSTEDNLSDDEIVIENKSKEKKNKKSRRSKIEVKISEDEEEVPDILGEALKENDEWSDNKKNKKGKQKKVNAKIHPIDKSQNKDLNPPVKIVAKAAVNEAETSECDINNSCVTCKNIFPSKNKLFQHLKSTGHGVYIPKDEQIEPNRKRGKRIK